MTGTKTTKRDVNKKEEIRQRTNITLSIRPPLSSPSNVEDIPITSLRDSIVVVVSCTVALYIADPRTVVPYTVAVTINATTIITNQFFPTLQVGEYKKEEKKEEEKEEAFIPSPSTTSTVIT